MLGSRDFYQHLRTMDNDERETIQMREISFVNQLYGGEELRRLQRLSGRFVNSAMMATMMGAVISDTLDDGQVVSGVGGQYNFVSMGHALEDGRSIIILRSTRMKDGAPLSNLVWSSGNATIPRHLRDVVVTEYGIADLRGKTDSQCIKAMLNITDSRFQNELMKKAKAVKKLEADYRIPDIFRSNTSEMLEAALRPYKKEGFCKMFPYGCDFTKEELVLGKALRGLKAKMSFQGFELPPINKLGAILRPSKNSIPFLERMGLLRPATFKEKVLQKLVLYALATDGSI
jgi:acyl-CoA hydrolase